MLVSTVANTLLDYVKENGDKEVSYAEIREGEMGIFVFFHPVVHEVVTKIDIPLKESDSKD